MSPMASKTQGTRPFTAAVGNRNKKRPLVNISPMSPTNVTNATSSKKQVKSSN